MAHGPQRSALGSGETTRPPRLAPAATRPRGAAPRHRRTPRRRTSCAPLPGDRAPSGRSARGPVRGQASHRLSLLPLSRSPRLARSNSFGFRRDAPFARSVPPCVARTDSRCPPWLAPVPGGESHGTRDHHSSGAGPRHDLERRGRPAVAAQAGPITPRVRSESARIVEAIARGGQARRHSGASSRPSRRRTAWCSSMRACARTVCGCVF